MSNSGGHTLEMRHKFLALAVATVLIGLVTGQQPYVNGFQSFNYASGGNGPKSPVNYGNLQNFAPYNQAPFFPNSGFGIPGAIVQSNPAAGQASGAASFFSQISNQPSGNNDQFTGHLGNTVNSQLSPADSIMSSIENNPLIKQYLPGRTNAHPVTNGAQFIQSNQNGFLTPNVFGSNPLLNVNPSYSVQTSNVAGPSFFPQNNNQALINNLQYSNSFSNPAGSQVSLPDSVMTSIANNPVIKQILQSPTNTNPVTNGGQFIQNSQNGFPVNYVTGSKPFPNINPWLGTNAASASSNPVGSPVSLADSVRSSIENIPVVKQILQNPANTNPIRNGAQLIQNFRNGFPVSYITGSNSLPYVNPWPVNNAASTSFNPQIAYQPQIQSSNSFINPGSSPLSSSDSTYTIENNPLIKQYRPGSTNPGTNGAQFIQNFQNGYFNPQPNGFNPLPNGNPSDIVLSSQRRNPTLANFFNDPANQMQVINQALNPLPNTNPANAIQNLPENIPLIKKFLNDPANQQFLINRGSNASPNSNASVVVQDFIEKIPAMKQFLDNPANQQLLINRVPSANSSIEVLNFLEKNPLVKQFLNHPKSQRIILNKVPRPSKPKRRNRRPVSKRPNSSPKSNSWSSADNYNIGVSSIDESSNNPTPSGVSTLSPNSFPDYSLPTDVPIEYPRSDFPKGFFIDMLKSLETDSKSASSSAAKQPKRRRKCKGQRSRTGTGSSSKSTVAANAGSTTFSPTDGANLFTLNNIGTVNQVTDSMFSDSSQAGTTLTTIYPSDIPKQLPLNNIKVIDSLGSSKAPSTRKRKCRKRTKINVTDLVSKIPSNSDLTSATATSLLMTTPQISSSESVTVIDTKNMNQNPDLTTVGLSSVQPKKKKKCNRNRVMPKAENVNSRIDFLKGKSDILLSVTDILNLSNASNNNDTNSRSSGKGQKSRKCKLKKERMKTASTKGPTSVSTSGPTTGKLTDTTTQNVAATDSSVTNTDAGKATTVGSDSCGEDEVWWDCKPRNNTCTNVARGRSQMNFVCEPGCYCADDLVKDVDGTCVDPDDCAAPVCRDEDHEELTDCLIECNRCEDDCHPCKMQSCVNGCDCKDGYKRNDNGTCVLDAHCPPCPTVSPAVISD